MITMVEDVMGLEAATFKSLSNSDVSELESDLAKVVSSEKSPLIAELIEKNKGNVKKLIEAVNDNSKQGYGGLSADGSELVAQWITPQDWGNLGEVDESINGWQEDYASSGVQWFFPSSGDFCSLGEEEGVIIFGFMNKVSNPVTDAVKIYKGTEESVTENLAFRATQYMDSKDEDGNHQGGTLDTPVVELRKPVLIPPESKFKIEHKKPISGMDALQPLGFVIQKAEDAWSLTL